MIYERMKEWLGDKELVKCVTVLRFVQTEEGRRFPVLNTQTHIPWSIAEKAYSQYSMRYGRTQSIWTIAQRGGFSLKELDEFYPAWRKETDLIKKFIDLLQEFSPSLTSCQQQKILMVLNEV